MFDSVSPLLPSCKRLHWSAENPAACRTFAERETVHHRCSTPVSVNARSSRLGEKSSTTSLSARAEPGITTRLIPSGKLTYNYMERSTIFHGKIHYFDWAIFQFANCSFTTPGNWFVIGISSPTSWDDPPRRPGVFGNMGNNIPEMVMTGCDWEKEYEQDGEAWNLLVNSIFQKKLNATCFFDIAWYFICSEFVMFLVVI